MINKVEILLVEDNTNDAEMTINALKKNNLANHLIHVKDGEAALDFVFGKGLYTGRLAEDAPKVILLDLKMPKVNGIEVLQQIRGNEGTRRIPVVILTSSAEDPDIQKCYDLGANSYVVKPVEFELFQKAITQLGLFWMIVNRSPQ